MTEPSAAGPRREVPTTRSADGGAVGMERVGSAYVGAAADSYFAHQAPMGELGVELEKAKFVDHVGPADTVIDFGCGAGGLLCSLDVAERIGVEVSEPARRAARASGLRVVPSLAELGDGIADVVISNHALEHTLAPLTELREILRVLRPGGRLVLWLPMDDWRADRPPDQDVDHHLYTWTPMLIRNLLGEAGFTVHSARVVAHAWPPQTVRLLRLPRPAFDAIARLWSMFRHRRQVTVVATKGPEH